MLSVLASSSVSSLRKLDVQIDKFYDNGHAFNHENTPM